MKTLLLLFFAPGYREQMPKANDQKLYRAGAYQYSPWYKHSPVERVIKGRRRAYIEARWQALLLDWITRSPEVGVDWFVQEL